MALVLSLKEGQDFFVGGKRFVLCNVVNQTQFDLAMDGEGSKLFQITDKHTTEIMHDVLVSAGRPPTSSMVRVAIDAPRSMKVARGEKKHV